MCEILEKLLSQDETIASYKQISTIKKDNRKTIVEVEICFKNGITVRLIAKLFVQSDLQRARKEVVFYDIILPMLKHFQEKERIDELYFFPVRYEVKSNAENSILLLENLKVQNYTTLNKGFGLNVARQVLNDLASFHAIPLALKIKDPKVFDSKIKKYLSTGVPIENIELTKLATKMLEKESTLYPYLDTIRDKLEDIFCDSSVRAPFSTMIHRECCFKNIMVKTYSSGSVDIKLIDFQHCSFGSLAEDLIFFLYSSVPTEILEEHGEALIGFYHSNFLRVLEECGCDPTPFSLSALLKEMKIVAGESQFAHVILTLFSNIYFNKNITEDESTCIMERVLFTVRDFVSKDWI